MRTSNDQLTNVESYVSIRLPSPEGWYLCKSGRSKWSDTKQYICLKRYQPESRSHIWPITAPFLHNWLVRWFVCLKGEEPIQSVHLTSILRQLPRSGDKLRSLSCKTRNNDVYKYILLLFISVELLVGPLSLRYWMFSAKGLSWKWFIFFFAYVSLKILYYIFRKDSQWVVHLWSKL